MMTAERDGTTETPAGATTEATDPPVEIRQPGLIGWLRRWLTHIPQVPRWQYLGYLAVLAVLVYWGGTTIKENGDRDRARAEAASVTRDYEQQLTSWNQARIVYTACLESVTRSDGNRAWKIWLLDFIQENAPGSDFGTRLVTEGRVKLDELLPARSPSECEDPGPPPVAPDNG